MSRFADITIITRADDCGNSHEANLGIAEELEAGILKNISLMAPGACIEEAARLFAGHQEICFGLHAVLNADCMPVLPAATVPSLVNAQGLFWPTPAAFTTQSPDLDEVMAEFCAQLSKLRILGFTITYVDTHWLIECQIPGLEERLYRWTESEGLIYHAYYCTTIPKVSNALSLIDDRVARLSSAKPGQYLYVAHPALSSPEFGLFSDSRILQVIQERSIEPIRYDQAIPVTQRIPPLHEWFS